MVSMADASGGGCRRTSRWETICSACSPGFRGRQYRVRGDVRARLLGELGASVYQRPPTRRPPPILWTTRTRPHFHHTGCRISGIKDCWTVESLSDLKLAPFQLLATEGHVHTDKDHRWHMERLAEVCRTDPELLRATPDLVVHVTDPDSQALGV